MVVLLVLELEGGATCNGALVFSFLAGCCWSLSFEEEEDTDDESSSDDMFVRLLRMRCRVQYCVWKTRIGTKDYRCRKMNGHDEGNELGWSFLELSFGSCWRKFSPFPFALLAMTQKEGLSVPVASVLFTTLLTLPCRVVFYWRESQRKISTAHFPRRREKDFASRLSEEVVQDCLLPCTWLPWWNGGSLRLLLMYLNLVNQKDGILVLVYGVPESSLGESHREVRIKCCGKI